MIYYNYFPPFSYQANLYWSDQLVILSVWSDKLQTFERKLL